MSSLWNFFKRHRRTFVVTGAAAAGVFLLQRYLKEKPFWEKLNLTSGEAVLSQQKVYIFESYKHTCNKTICNMLPCLMQKLKEIYDIEAMVEQLKTSNEKLQIWNQMKLQCFTRLLTACYASTLLVLAMNSQISLLAQQIWTDQNSNLFSRVSSLLQSYSQTMFPAITTSSGKLSSANAQIFIQSLQYFTKFGVERLAQRIEQCVAAAMSQYTLKDKLNAEKVSRLLMDIRSEIESNDYRTFAYFVVPISADQLPTGNTELQMLFQRLRQVICSNVCRSAFEQMIDQFLRRIIEFVQEVGPTDLRNDEGIPMAKLIPLLTDAFHEVTSVKDNSLIVQLLHSDELKTFSSIVFETCY